MATTQSIHMGPEWMRPQPASQTTINPPSKNPSSQPPSLGIVPNALRNAEGLKTSAASTTGANAERGALGPALTAQAVSANGTSVPGATPAIPYSSLLNSGSTNQMHKVPGESLDGANQDPFRYSRDQLVSIWRNGTTSQGGPGWSLGIEVERYEGIVLDFEGIPSCSRELTDAEQKLYHQASLNSRRPSISHTLSEHRRDDHLRRGTALNGDGGEPTGLGILGRRGTGDGLSLATSGKGFGSFLTNGPLSPMKDRFARRDSNQTGTTYRPRQLSVGTTGLTGDRDVTLPSPRGPGAFSFGGGTSFAMHSAGDGWGGRRKTGALADVGRIASQRDKIRESDEFAQRDSSQSDQQLSATAEPVTAEPGEPGEVTEDNVESASLDNWEDDSEIADVGAGVAVGVDAKVMNGNSSSESPPSVLANSVTGLEIDSTNGVNGHTSKATPPPPDPATIKWSYYDDSKNLQGPFTPDQLKLWNSSGWLRPNLVMLRTQYDTGAFQLSEWQAMAARRGVKEEGMFHIWHAPITRAADLLLPVAPPKEEPKPASIPSAPVSSVAQSDIGSPARSVFAAITYANAQRSSSISLLSGSRSRPRANEVDPNPIFNPLSPARMQAQPGTMGGSSTSSPASMNASTTDSALGVGGIGNGGVFVRGPGTIGSTVPSGQAPSSNYHPTAGRFGTVDPMHAFGGGGLGFGNGFGGFEDAFTQRLPSGTYARTYDHSAVTSPHQPWSQSIGASTPASYGRTAATTFGGRRSESPIPGVGALGGDVHDVTGSNRGVDSVGLGIGSQPQPQRYVPPLPPPHEQQHRRSQGMFGPYGTQVIGGPVQATQPPVPLPIPPVVKNDEEVMNRPKGPLDQELIPTILPNSPVNPIPEGSLIQKPRAQPQPSLQAQTQPPGQEVPAPAPVPPTPALVPAPKATRPASVEVDDSNQPFTQVKNKKHYNPQSQLAQVAAPTPAQSGPVKVEHASNTPPTNITVNLASLITLGVPSSSPISAPKTAWATPAAKDEATKSLTLKEIQAAEEKRAKEEAFRQKAAAVSTFPTPANAIASGSRDEVEILTWGLPTSKAGSRPTVTPSPASTGAGKDVPPSGPVWATASKGGISAGASSAKKTMKEIQEEEERKRRREKEANSTTAAKKVTENRSSAPTPSATGNAWSTVGVGGKVASVPAPRPTGLAALPPKPTAAAAAANRPSAVAAPLFSTAASVGMPTRKVTPSPASKPSAIPPKSVDEPQEPPVSAETTRWMKDTLQRGLKPGSSVDVIVSMVLSIQEEEFIADIIYQSSETMNGQRWAAELLSRRKADAASTSSASGINERAGSTSGSMAEVLKAQPRQPAQDSGYKVVKKKGKSGRA